MNPPHKMLRCIKYDKECLDPHTLENHITIVHEGESPFGCDVFKKVLGSKVLQRWKTIWTSMSNLRFEIFKV